jgi:hypothetical protein
VDWEGQKFGIVMQAGLLMMEITSEFNGTNGTITLELRETNRKSKNNNTVIIIIIITIRKIRKKNRK